MFMGTRTLDDISFPDRTRNIFYTHLRHARRIKSFLIETREFPFSATSFVGFYPGGWPYVSWLTSACVFDSLASARASSNRRCYSPGIQLRPAGARGADRTRAFPRACTNLDAREGRRRTLLEDGTCSLSRNNRGRVCSTSNKSPRARAHYNFEINARVRSRKIGDGKRNSHCTSMTARDQSRREMLRYPRRRMSPCN